MIQAPDLVESIAIEATEDTNPILEDVVIKGLVLGVPPENVIDSASQITFVPPPPISEGCVEGTSPSAFQTVSPNAASPVPIAVPGQQLFAGKSRLVLYMGMIGAILVAVVLGGMLLLHNSNSQTTAPKEIERLVQEREHALTRLKEIEREKGELHRKVRTEAERANREVKEKQEALSKLTQAEQAKLDAERRARSEAERAGREKSEKEVALDMIRKLKQEEGHLYYTEDWLRYVLGILTAVGLENKGKQIENKWRELQHLRDQLLKLGPMLKEEVRNQKIKELGIAEMEWHLAIRDALSQIQNQQRFEPVGPTPKPGILRPPVKKPAAPAK